MKKTGLLVICLVLALGGVVRADKLLTIENRQTIEDREPASSECRHCFYSGRAKEKFISVDRERPFALPKAALPQDYRDTINIVAIRVDFSYEDPDDPLTTGRGLFDLRDTATFLAQEGHALDPAPHNRHYFEAHLRSLAQYYKIVSRGRLVLQYEVWPRESDSAYHLNESISHYGEQAPAFGLGEFFHDALDAAHEAEGDDLWFRDERGKRKAVVIFHAGADRQTDLWFSATPTVNDLFTGFLTFEGPNRWFMDPDTLISGIDTIVSGRDTVVEGLVMPETMTQDNRVTCMNAVLAHEFGHQLGLVDLYSTGTTPFLTQMGDFALMDNIGMNTAAYIGEYGVGAFGTVPLFPMAWSRAYLGFEEVVEYSAGTSIELAAVKMQTEGTKIVRIPISSTQYYLLENRRSDMDGPVGLRQDSTSNVILWPARYDEDGDSIIALPEYDLYTPIGTAGIAVWLVDEMVAAMDYYPFDGFDNNFDANTLQWDPKRKFITLMEADGIIDFGGNYHRGFGNPQDLFYAGNNSSFGTYTNPASISNDGGYTHIEINNISEPGMIMTFDLNQSKMADNFPRRVGIPHDPDMKSVAADLDGDGTDEIITVSRNRIQVMNLDGRSYIDPDGLWDNDPRNMDTIYSAIQSMTDANSRKPIDTSFVTMPVFATTQGAITAGPVVATFQDTTLVMVGDDFGIVYKFLTFDSSSGPGNLNRADLMQVRNTQGNGDVIAIIPDRVRGLIHAVYESGAVSTAAWNVGGPVSEITFNLDGDFKGYCRYKGGMAFVYENDDKTTFYVSGENFGWPADSLAAVDSLDGAGCHEPVATDFDRDGNDEIVLLFSDGRIMTYTCGQDEQAPYQPLYDIYTYDTTAAPPTVADLTGNGYPELIVTGTNSLYGFDRNGITVSDFPATVDYARPEQLIITRPVISDITGDGFPDMVVTALDSILNEKYQAAYYLEYPDPENYPDSFIVVDTMLQYFFYNYFSNVYVVSPGTRRIEGFPVPGGAFGIRQPGDTVVGAGAALHVGSGNQGLLVTAGADGWLRAWESGWSDRAALWTMSYRTADGSAYLPLEQLGEEIVASELLPENRFYNYPNPARGQETHIRFHVSQPARVTITIIDAVGDEIWKEFRDITEGNSENEVTWNLSGVASGVYHCRLEAEAISGGESKVAFKTIAVIK